MIKFLFSKVIILLIISISCDTSNYVCNKNIVPCGCGEINVTINAQMVNGENSIPNSWPMIVSLRTGQSSSTHICGGTILNESYILTAARCAHRFLPDFLLKNLTIVAGIHKLSQPDQIIRRADKIIIHPLWEKFNSDVQYDIALIHLVKPLNLSKSSSLIRTCLPPHSNTSEEIMQYPSNGTSLVVIGWGRLETGGSRPDTLQQVTVNSIHHFDRVCSTSILDPSIQFCAGVYGNGKGVCRGDLGGPILQWIGDRWEQVGIVSYSEEGCTKKSYPAVFTRISYFHDWIESHIHENTLSNHRILYQCTEYLQCGGCGRQKVALSPSTAVKSEDALPHSWSMIVSIRVGTDHQHICTGTILKDFYILTTAHCLSNRSAKDLTIEAGMYYRSESGAIIRQVARIYIHPDYTAHSNSFMNDIAILQLALPFYVEDDPFISRTCLPSNDDQWMNATKYLSNGTRLAISGWDIKNTLKSAMPKVLQQAEVYFIDENNSDCSLSDSQHPIQFCAGRYGNDKEICNEGGFGDPIFQLIDDRWVQVGIGSSCGVSDKLVIFTSLAAYSSWIESVLNSTIETLSNTYQCDKKAPCGCGQTDVKLSVNGIIDVETAIEHSWPMIVSIQVNGWHTCAGTILSDSFILTSVECVSRFFNYSSNMTIVAGINTLSETVTVRRKIDKKYIYPNYSSLRSYLHAVAIVHLDQPLPIHDVSSILVKTCVPAESESLIDDYPKSNLSLVVIGWNMDESEDRVSNALQQISVRMLEKEHELCPTYSINHTYQFCAGPSSKTKSRKMRYLCNGGMGGPVLIYKNNHWEQVGIIPFPYGCNYRSHAEIYIRLSPYLEWMKNVTNSSLTTYPSPIHNNGIRNQRRNTLIVEIFFLLIIILL